MLDLDLVLKLNDNIVLRGVSDKYWALNINTGSQYRLNEVSYFILNCFRTNTSVNRMLEEVMIEYRVERQRLMLDCEGILKLAMDNGIIEEVTL